MTVEPGKYYRTRCGDLAYVAALAPPEIAAFAPEVAAVGWIIIDDMAWPNGWSVTGISERVPGRPDSVQEEDRDDLVAAEKQ